MARDAPRIQLGTQRGASTLVSRSLTAIAPVTVQIALSVLLLASSGLMLRTYWNLEHLNPGFDRAHVVSFTLGMRDAGLTKQQAGAYLTELVRRMRSLPAVRSVAYSDLGLMRGTGQKRTLTAPGVTQPPSVYLNSSNLAISPDYFDALGIRLLAGRTLAAQDKHTKPEPVVINRALAKLLFPTTNPLGQSIVLGNDGTVPPAFQIVGLVEASKYRLMRERAPPTMYTLMQDEDYSAVLYVRTTGSPLDLMRPAQEQIRRMGGGVPLIEAETLEQEVQNSLWQERLVAGLACFFSFVALLLAAIGLYGTLAYSVVRRKRELAIRIALGAEMRHIVETVCGRMTAAVGIGILAGWALSAAALRFARGFLFEVNPFDKLSFAGATAAVLVCAAFAALIPSRRAVRTNTSTALREQ